MECAENTDEIKAKLPLDLNDSYHLLFIVDDIFDNDPTQIETKFGYLPLFTEGHLIQNGEHTMIPFILGCAVGGMVGVVTMCLFQINNTSGKED